MTPKLPKLKTFNTEVENGVGDVCPEERKYPPQEHYNKYFG